MGDRWAFQSFDIFGLRTQLSLRRFFVCYAAAFDNISLGFRFTTARRRGMMPQPRLTRTTPRQPNPGPPSIKAAKPPNAGSRDGCCRHWLPQDGGSLAGLAILILGCVCLNRRWRKNPSLFDDKEMAPSCCENPCQPQFFTASDITPSCMAGLTGRRNRFPMIAGPRVRARYRVPRRPGPERTDNR